MNDDQFQKGKREYGQYMNKTIDAIEKFKLPTFLSIEIDCSKLDNSAVESILNKVFSVKQYNSLQCLYYFQVFDLAVIPKISKNVQNLKDGKNVIKLPQVNEHLESPILYVGKTNKNFQNRLKCHLSASQPATYALHLSEWATEINLTLRLHYCFVESNVINNEVLEHIETIMHQQLKPILGRQGH